MMVPLLMFGAAASSAHADAASLAFVRCLFAQSRLAHETHLSPDQFEAVLAGRCRAEERAVPDATADGAAMKEARQMVVDDYRRAVELEPQLKRLGELCRAHPEQCRD
jgi:hypothetical protein